MFKIKGNTLSAEGVRFTLPEGFYIDNEGLESVDKNGLRLVPEELDCFIWMRTESDDYETAMDSLLDSFSDFVFESGSAIESFEDPENEKYQWIVRPRRYTHNGMTGACCTYTALSSDVCRLHFEKADGFDERFVIFMQIDRAKTDMETVLSRPHVKAFFDSIAASAK